MAPVMVFVGYGDNELRFFNVMKNMDVWMMHPLHHHRSMSARA
jgi:hypothetical protein